jgi:hypothetical protein
MFVQDEKQWLNSWGDERSITVSKNEKMCALFPSGLK